MAEVAQPWHPFAPPPCRSPNRGRTCRSPQTERTMYQYFLRHWAEWQVDDWRLNFAVYLLDDGTMRSNCVGNQITMAKHFPATRLVTTGSWLGPRVPGTGARQGGPGRGAAPGIRGTGAVRAESDALADNIASQKVTLAMGYHPNGETHRHASATPPRSSGGSPSIGPTGNRSDATTSPSTASTARSTCSACEPLRHAPLRPTFRRCDDWSPTGSARGATRAGACATPQTRGSRPS